MAHGGKREGSGRKKTIQSIQRANSSCHDTFVSIIYSTSAITKKSQYHESNESNTPFIPHPTALSLERPFFLNAVCCFSRHSY